MQTDGTNALVVGGASGLGEATARRLHADGAAVVIADLNADKGDALAAELGDRARFVEANVLEADQVEAAVAAATEGGELRISVCCAGIGWAQRTVSKQGPHDLEIFSNVIKVNLIGTFNVAAARRRRDGRTTSPTTRASAASASTPPRSPPSTGRSARSPTPRRRAASSGSPFRPPATSPAAASA